MLEIKLSLERQDVVELCQACGRPWSEAIFVYQAVDRGEVLAAGLFEVESDDAQALYYRSREPEDAFLFDGILRAGLNYAASQGIETGVLPEEFRQAHKALFEKLNYPPEDRFNIVNFFQKYKACRPGLGG